MKKTTVQYQTKNRFTPEGAGTSSLKVKAQRFHDAYSQVRSDRTVPLEFATKLHEALETWAIMKMGREKLRYMKVAFQSFVVLCTIQKLQTNHDMGQIVKEVPVQFPLHLRKKRTDFTELIPDHFRLAGEYEQVRAAVGSAKRKATSDAHVKLLLREILRDPATSQLPDNFEKKLAGYELGTTPSKIALDYVGSKNGTSGANIKKIVRRVGRGDLMFASLGKHLRKTYLPNDGVLKYLLDPSLSREEIEDLRRTQKE